MRRISGATLVGPVVLALLLAGCDEGETAARRGGSGAFRDDYLVARKALEIGHYENALAGYRSLVDRAGPATPRVRLEYAHALLRANSFEAAAEQAGLAAAEQDGLARASALAVQAIARHEIARLALGRGESGAAVKAGLVAARDALDQALKDHAAIDPAGGLAARRTEIAQALAAL